MAEKNANRNRAKAKSEGREVDRIFDSIFEGYLPRESSGLREEFAAWREHREAQGVRERVQIGYETGPQAAKADEEAGPSASIPAAAELLGGARVLASAPESPLEAHDLLVAGLTVDTLDHIVKRVAVLRDTEMFEQALGMSLRTYQRRRETPERPLSVEQSARLWKFAEILSQAGAVFGSVNEAENWLTRPATGLDGRRPIDLLATPAGVQLVEEHLGRLRYGVYA